VVAKIFIGFGVELEGTLLVLRQTQQETSKDNAAWNTSGNQTITPSWFELPVLCN